MPLQFRSFLYLVAVCCFLLCDARAHAGNVLLLHSTNTDPEWISGVAEGVTDVLSKDTVISPIPVGTALDGVEHFDSVFRTIREKYDGQSLDGLIADGPIAHAFLRKYREELAPYAPVVYCSMPAPDPERLIACDLCSGVPMDFGIAQTMGLIFRLRPETSLVVGIIDGSEAATTFRRRAERSMEPYLDRASLIFPGHEPGDDRGLDSAMLRDVAASVPYSGAILILQYDHDTSAPASSLNKIVQMVAERSDAPVYVVRQGGMGSGALAGVVPLAEDQGRQAGQILQRILAGEDAATLLVEAVPPVTVIDQTVATRFAIPSERFPPEAKVINPLPSPTPDQELTSMTGWLLGCLFAFIALAAVLVRRATG